MVFAKNTSLLCFGMVCSISVCTGLGATEFMMMFPSNILAKLFVSCYRQAIVIWATIHGFSSLIIDGFMDVKEIQEKVYATFFETLFGIGCKQGKNHLNHSTTQQTTTTKKLKLF